MRPSKRVAIACARRSATRDSSFPTIESPSILRRPTCARPGSSFDLPIALGLLATSGPLTRRCVDDTVIVGELSLDGAINGIRGVLPIAVGARRLGLKRLLLPPQNATEASVVEGLDICVAQSLAEAVEALNEPERAKRATAGPVSTSSYDTSRQRSGRRSRATARQARARSGGCWRSQPADDRPSRCRQDDAGEKTGNDSAAAHVR